MSVGTTIIKLQELSDKQGFVADALLAILERASDNPEDNLPGESIIRGVVACQADITEKFEEIIAELEKVKNR